MQTDEPVKAADIILSIEQHDSYVQCLQLLNLGFPQKRKFQAMYYVGPAMLICIDDLSALKNDGHTDFENIFSRLVFKPRFEELVEESPWLHEFIKLDDETWMAYSKIEEDPDYIKETGRQDKMIRAQGNNPQEALRKLWIAVKSKERKSSMTPEDVSMSENQVQAKEPNE